MNHHILVIDDDPGMIQVIAHVLGDEAHIRFAKRGDDALRMARQSPPDLILLDAQMPGLNGYMVCELLRADPALAHVPVVFLTMHDDPVFEIGAYEAGAVDFVTKPFHVPVLAARVRSLLRMKQLADERAASAFRDTLTGLSSRSRFVDVLNREWARGLRAGDAASLVLVDVDHFRAFNDNYGDAAGDACLQSLAVCLQAAARRPADEVARIDGGQFAVLLPQTPHLGSRLVAQRIVDAVRQMRVPHAASPTADQITVSVGVAHFDHNSPAWAEPSATAPMGNAVRLRFAGRDLLRTAEKALAMAKRAGRARIESLDVADVDAPSTMPEVGAAEVGATQARLSMA